MDVEQDPTAAFGHFVAGFISGEGSFFVNFLQRSGRLPQVQCGFSVHVRADDEAIVRSIWKALGYPGAIHSIESHRYRYAKDPIRRHDSIMLIVRSRKELITQVIPFFDRYPLRGMKRRNYDIWKKAVYLLESGEHLTPEGLDKFVVLRTELNKYQGQDKAPPMAGGNDEGKAP